MLPNESEVAQCLINAVHGKFPLCEVQVSKLAVSGLRGHLGQNVLEIISTSLDGAIRNG